MCVITKTTRGAGEQALDIYIYTQGREYEYYTIEEEVSQNYEFAGPTEKLPSGLKHIRENSSEEDKPKSNKEEA